MQKLVIVLLFSLILFSFLTDGHRFYDRHFGPVIVTQSINDSRESSIRITLQTNNPIDPRRGLSLDICQHPITIPVCKSQNLKLRCETIHGSFGSNTNFSVGKNDNPRMASSRLTSRNDDAYHLRLMSQSDSDYYYCWFKQEYQDNYYASSCIKPVFHDCSTKSMSEQPTYKQHIGSNVTLTCHDGQIEPNSSITWFERKGAHWSSKEMAVKTSNDTVYFGEKENVLEPVNSTVPSVQNTLTISNISRADAVEYFCFVWSSSKKTAYQREFKVAIYAPPSNISSLFVINKSSTVLQLRYFVQGGQNFIQAELDTGDIQYQPIDNSAPPIKLSVNISQQGELINITNLSSDTLYKVQLTVKNSLGDGSPASGIFLTRQANASSIPTLAYDEEVTGPIGSLVELKCYHKYKNDSSVNWNVGGPFGYTYREGWSVQLDKFTINDAMAGASCVKSYHGIEHFYHIRLGILLPPTTPEEFHCRGSSERGLMFYWVHPETNPNITSMKESISKSPEYRRPNQELVEIVDNVQYYTLKYRKLDCDDDWKEKNITGTCLSTVVRESATLGAAFVGRLIAVNAAGQTEVKTCTCYIQ